MGIYLNPLNSGFEDSLRSEIYVDKSELIAYTNRCLDTEQKFICVSRPRRFGKTMAVDMLSAYYCRTCDSKKLFQNLKIAQNSDFEEHLNQYDVIALNMQQMLSSSQKDGTMLDFLQKKVLKDLRAAYPTEFERNEVDSDIDLIEALETIFANRKQRFVFLIDEWDCIFREKQQDHVMQQLYLDFLRNLLKDRPYVKLTYMTGILPIKKYGTHSALNMFDEYSMIDTGELAEFTGFTAQEVDALCQTYGVNTEEMYGWYDGYHLNEQIHIFNPKSVVDCLRRKRFGSYWTQTETYEALRVYVDMNFDGLKDAIVQMLGGGRCAINPRTFTNDMTTLYKKDDVLTLLVHLGYLAFDHDRQEVSIPNEEIRQEFLNAIEASGWQDVLQAVQASKNLLEAVWKGDAATVSKELDAVHMETTSILQYNNENSLSCVISLAFYSARDYYMLIRELPTGKGFADIVFLPRRGSDKPAMVVELKWNSSAEGAINQIKKQQYGAALKDYTGDLLLIGINYNKETKTHQCVIENDMKK